MPAFADARFADTASEIWSEAAIAHVRAATVGNVSEDNTHPFTFGVWAFAHNGTIGAFEHVATRLDIGAFGPPDGETDSELVFLWLLNRMENYGLDPHEPADSLEPIVELLADAVLELVDLSVHSGADEQPKLNFLLSDGKHLAASRWGNSLYWTFRRQVRDCAVCGTSHCPSADYRYRAVVVASEPITDEDWMEVPEGSVLGVEPRAHTLRRNLFGVPSRTQMPGARHAGRARCRGSARSTRYSPVSAVNEPDTRVDGRPERNARFMGDLRLMTSP